MARPQLRSNYGGQTLNNSSSCWLGCLWIVAEKIIDCPSSGLFCWTNLWTVVCTVDGSLCFCQVVPDKTLGSLSSNLLGWTIACVVVVLFAVDISLCCYCRVPSGFALSNGWLGLIDLFVDGKLVPRDLWTLHLQVGSIGRSTDVILVESVHCMFIFKGWYSDFFDTDRFVENLRCFMGSMP